MAVYLWGKSARINPSIYWGSTATEIGTEQCILLKGEKEDAIEIISILDLPSVSIHVHTVIQLCVCRSPTSTRGWSPGPIGATRAKDQAKIRDALLLPDLFFCPNFLLLFLGVATCLHHETIHRYPSGDSACSSCLVAKVADHSRPHCGCADSQRPCSSSMVRSFRLVRSLLLWGHQSYQGIYPLLTSSIRGL